MYKVSCRLPTVETTFRLQTSDVLVSELQIWVAYPTMPTTGSVTCASTWPAGSAVKIAGTCAATPTVTSAISTARTICNK